LNRNCLRGRSNTSQTPAESQVLSLHVSVVADVCQIKLPEICSNVCFGGTKRNLLFITASQSLYAVYVETRGAHIT
jgi:sugar lactone lactonase YvrE